jgi:uncharacterized protein
VNGQQRKLEEGTTIMTAKSSVQAIQQPWYREPWLWFIAAGPIAVVIAGVITTFIAYSTADGLVADDYYKRGLTINRALARDRRADELGLAGEMRIDHSLHRVRVLLRARDQDYQFSPSLTVKVLHSIRASDDRSVVLAAIGNGVYIGELELEVPGRAPSRITIESPEWRLTGMLRPEAAEVVTLRPANASDMASTR